MVSLEKYFRRTLKQRVDDHTLCGSHWICERRFMKYFLILICLSISTIASASTQYTCIGISPNVSNHYIAFHNNRVVVVNLDRSRIGGNFSGTLQLPPKKDLAFEYVGNEDTHIDTSDAAWGKERILKVSKRLMIGEGWGLVTMHREEDGANQSYSFTCNNEN